MKEDKRTSFRNPQLTVNLISESSETEAITYVD